MKILKGYKSYVYGHMNKTERILEKMFWLIYINYSIDQKLYHVGIVCRW